MKRLHILAVTLIAFLPTAHAQGGLGTSFDDALTTLCDTHGSLASSVPIGGIDISVPGLSDIGLDLRPLCQYADIAKKGTDMLQGVRDGTLQSTEGFINDALATLIGSVGGRLETERANEIIAELDEDLRTALGSGPDALTAYRDVLNRGLEDLRGEAGDQIDNDFREAVTHVQEAEPGEVTSEQRARATVPFVEGQRAASEAQAGQAAQQLELDLLTEASAEQIRQQEENNAYQQTIEDTLKVETVPGSESGLAEQAVKDARSATSVRQSINVLTEALANQMRNDAIFSGGVIENLQANARQQAITNHQLQVLTSNIIAEQETKLSQDLATINHELTSMQEEVEESYRSFASNLEDAARVTSSEPMETIDFSYCGLFGGC